MPIKLLLLVDINKRISVIEAPTDVVVVICAADPAFIRWLLLPLSKEDNGNEEEYESMVWDSNNPQTPGLYLWEGCIEAFCGRHDCCWEHVTGTHEEVNLDMCGEFKFLRSLADVVALTQVSVVS